MGGDRCEGKPFCDDPGGRFCLADRNPFLRAVRASPADVPLQQHAAADSQLSALTLKKWLWVKRIGLRFVKRVATDPH